MPGVKGLAAMFEQRGDTSPPDLTRGRSPNALSGTPPLSDSPRPLSKIRTQFVAVEKDGRIGLTRGISTDSMTSSSRRTSNETGTATPQPRSDPTSDPFTESTPAFRKITSNPISVPQSRPESPQKPLTSLGRMSPLKASGTSTPEVMPNANPDKITDEEETKTKLQPGLPTETIATRAVNSTVSNGIGDSLTRAAATTTSTKEVAGASTNASTKTKPASILTAKSATKAPKSPLPSKAPKSPLPPKAPKSPAKESLKVPAPAPAKKTSAVNLRDSHRKAAASSTAAPNTASTKKPATLELPQSGNGFVKPKVKSPTRPVKLPAGLTSQTASSSSRANNTTGAVPAKQPAKRSRSLAPSTSSQRPASRISTAGASDGTRTLRRQSSSINGGRQSIGSIGPPPKPNPKDQVAPKKDYHVDESFLARMMRPTQSSASKTTDKAPVTPPRKPAASKAPTKHIVGVDATASAKKAAAKIQASGSAKTRDGTSAKPKDISPVTKTALVGTTKETTQPLESKPAPVGPIEPAALTETAASGLGSKMDDLTIHNESSNISEVAVEHGVVEQAPEELPEVFVDSEKTEEVLPMEPTAAVTEEPLRVEDIEDVVHVVAEESVATTTDTHLVKDEAAAIISPDETEVTAEPSEEAKEETPAEVAV
ncbi:uncharacterized protein B0I36DRAFT_335801 [Microdochium trichocladiopsis]|uniref:Mucin-7 n=1 Tax=Microdochium trichocladiopsis TaxID=1682393 RepID=A0A9P9BJR0_9PEZI|nr:uncharacterized protein B0I36DRAFT_335801 [Microdochium trichocladiopsis]KAH7018345.1 hypothetical protein B0I36DRAFT_335801 [Microdochium trichocladiopsis]